MEILSQVSNTQFMFTAAAVGVVLVCAALVFVFGFHSAEPPEFGKLPLVLDDKKSSNKKSKKKDKKSSPNRTVPDDAKTKSEASKKSPAKEKTEEKAKEIEKLKPKERVVEARPVKKETVSDSKKGKKTKTVELEKPADFDDGGWQEVPKKNDKKKVKSVEEKEKKKESPKKNKKVAKDVKDADVEAAHPVEEPVEETIKVISAEGPQVDEDVARALQAQVEELQRVLKERERQDQAALVSTEDEESAEIEELTDVKDLRSNKKKENIEKQIKKKTVETAAVTKSTPKPELEKDNSDSEKQENQKAPVFDELGDTWTDAKVTSKKSKKKARKDQ